MTLRPGTRRNLTLLADRLEAVNERVGRALAWLAAAMVAVMFAVVVLRYVFDLGWIAMQESVSYMHALLFTLGAAYTLRHDGHVRIDIFYQRLTARQRAWVELVGTLGLLAPTAGAIIYLSWGYVVQSWLLLEGSDASGGLPGVFLIKTALVVMPALLLLQGAAQALRSAVTLTGGEER